MSTVIVLNPMGTDVTPYVDGTNQYQLMNGTILAPGDTLYTLPYDNTSGFANIEAGVALLDTKLHATTGHIKVFGYSEGCQIADMWLTNQGASTPIDPADLEFLLIGNADRKYGGFVYDHSIFDSVGWTQGKPDDTDYPCVDLTRQYDPVGDFPTAAPIVDALVGLTSVGTDSNAIAGALQAVADVMVSTPYMNAVSNVLAGLALVHTGLGVPGTGYMSVTVDDPSNIPYQEPGSNIVWLYSPTYPVPSLGTGGTFPQADLQLRTQIEQAYTRPVHIPMPNYGANTGWSVEPFPVPVTTAPVQGWWVEIIDPGNMSGSGTLSVVANVIVHATATLTGSGVLSATVQVGIFRSGPLTGSGVLAVTAAAKVPATVTLSGSGVLAASAVQQYNDTVTLTGSGVLSAAPIQQYAAAAGFTGPGNLSAAVIQQYPSITFLTGAGSLTAAVYAVQPDVAILTGSGVLAAAAAAKVPAAAILTGSGVLSSTSVQQFPQAVNLQAPGTLTATPIQQYNGTATLTGSGVLASGAIQQFQLSPALTGSGVLASAAVQSFTDTASLSGSGALSATVSSIEHAAADLTGSGSLSATGIQQYLDAAALTGSGVLSAAALQGAAITGTLTGSGALSVAAYAIESDTAALSGSGALSVTAAAKVPATVALTGSGALSATSLQSFSDPAVLTGSGALSATGIQQYNDTAALTGSGALSATASIVPSGPSVDAVWAGTDSITSGSTSLGGNIVPTTTVDVFLIYAYHGTSAPTRAATVGGSAMTLLGASTNSSSSGVLFYRKTGVTAGSKAISVATAAADTDSAAIAIAVKSVSSVGSIQNAAGTFSQNVTCSAGQLIIQLFFETRDGDITAYAGGTAQGIVNLGGVSGNGMLTLRTATATTTFTATTSTARGGGAAIVLS